MTRELVAAVLRQFPIAFASSLHGFDLDGATRLTTGGGIAGQMDTWWLIDRKTGEKRFGYAIRRIDDLRQALREWLAGPRPPERDGYRLHARRVVGTQRYAWGYRKHNESGG